MKSILQANGIQVPNFAVVESASDILNFVRKHHLPVVIKPRKGYSSVNTSIIKTQEDLEKFLDSGFNYKNALGLDGALDLEIECFIEVGLQFFFFFFALQNECLLCFGLLIFFF
eukprot:TRINITY_DN11436_c0_g1_i2.p1 TRINITY_DN11436_c0_g1~~TRINITY_DN11436_c0_g1_i2.p1  ORF type:complete len:114 (+),score=9.31 TRINITY_DN11436_c0_g1_i2:154-495(+)